ncbi:MAG: hypothetical protein RMK79_09700 [Anaerolineae bacterium]|nr:hypothetical protein [Anaerolineae bacterium]
MTTKLVIGTLCRAGDTWEASIRLGGGALFTASAIGPVEGDFCSDKPLDQATEVQALVKAPNGDLWSVKAQRVSSNEPVATEG